MASKLKKKQVQLDQQSITMNLDTSLVAEIDAEARQREGKSGIKLTRSNMIRALLTEALKILRNAHPQTGKEG